jgi:hypothetical protein
MSDINNMKYGYIPVGFFKHAIGLFFYKNNNDKNNITIDISIINTGDGCEYHGNFSNNNDIWYTNGIITFKNVQEEKAIFGIKYLIFLTINANSNAKICKDIFNSQIFYDTVYEYFNDYNELNETNIMFQLPIQNIGDCSFKSYIYHLIL